MTIHAVQAQSPKQDITKLLVGMGFRVEKILDQAITALLSRTHIPPAPTGNGPGVDELELAIDQAVSSALQNGEVRSSDIRQLTSAVNISKEMARLATLAASLGRRVSEVGEHCDDEDFSCLQPLAIAVAHLCRQTLRALAHLDPVLARNAAAGSAAVDAYRDYVYRGPRNSTPVSSQQNMHLLFASRCLEQIADHASDLAGELVTLLSAGSPGESNASKARRQIAC